MTAPSSDGDIPVSGVSRRLMEQKWANTGSTSPLATPPPAAFAVTSVTYSRADTTIDITCPGNEIVTITANITTSAGGTVSYKWDDSQGCLSGCPTESINFASAESKTVQHTMTVGAAGDY